MTRTDDEVEFLPNLSESQSKVKDRSPSVTSLVSPCRDQRSVENQASHCKRSKASAELIIITCARFPALGVGNAIFFWVMIGY